MPDATPVDILISYKSDERPIAARLAAALAAEGWHVWWDHHILAGEAYRKVIAEKLAEAGCVVVLWSQRSVESDFVLDEAGRAHRRGVLIPVRIAVVDIPLGFGQQDYTDLIDWDGDRAHAGFQELRSAIAGRLAGDTVTSSRAPTSPPPARSPSPMRFRTVGILAAAAALAALLMYWLWPDRSPREPAPIAVQIAVASGVIAAGLVIPSGLVVTPCHVVGELDEVLLRGAGEWDGPARVRERRCDVDLALLESTHGPLVPNAAVVRFAGSLAAGDAIERYRGASDRTPGKVIAPRESLAYLGDDSPAMKLLVTTHVSAGGDSGAPILDSQGRIVGMLVAGDGETRSFAIPVETIRETFINSFAP